MKFELQTNSITKNQILLLLSYPNLYNLIASLLPLKFSAFIAFGNNNR